MNFFIKMTLAASAVLAVAVAAIFLWRHPEAGRVEALLREAVGWVRAGEAEKCVELIDPDFKQGGERFEEVAALVRRHVRPELYRGLDIHDLDVSIEGRTAQAVLLLDVDRTDDALFGRPVRLRLDLTLKKRDKEWKVTAYRVSRDRGWFIPAE
ncbi:MAG: hypothetical protein HY716_15225 [Planctomycetes bacterium]|nr:hypothetical protein [Planctomycetota bacterium]